MLISYVEGFGVGVKFDFDFFGIWCLYEGDWGLVIKVNCFVGKVGDYVNLVFFGLGY